MKHDTNNSLITLTYLRAWHSNMSLSLQYMYRILHDNECEILFFSRDFSGHGPGHVFHRFLA